VQLRAMISTVGIAQIRKCHARNWFTVSVGTLHPAIFEVETARPQIRLIMPASFGVMRHKVKHMFRDT
jgi:hypothetical protein